MFYCEKLLASTQFVVHVQQACLVGAMFQLVNNALSRSLFFHLFAYITPQEVLRILVFYFRSYVYQVVNQLRYVAFVVVNMFE